MREKRSKRRKKKPLTLSAASWLEHTPTPCSSSFTGFSRSVLIITVIGRAYVDKSKTAQKLKSFKNTKREAQRKCAACFLRSVRKKMINELTREGEEGRRGVMGSPSNHNFF